MRFCGEVCSVSGVDEKEVLVARSGQKLEKWRCLIGENGPSQAENLKKLEFGGLLEDLDTNVVFG